MALLDPRHPGPYIPPFLLENIIPGKAVFYNLVRPSKALLGSVAVAVAVAVLILFRYLSNGGGSRKL